MSVENQRSQFGTDRGGTRTVTFVLVVALAILMTACGGRASDKASGNSG